MSQVLQTNESLIEKLHRNQLSQHEIMPLLTQYQMLPQLLRERLLDEAVSRWERATTASPSCTPEEIEIACQRFCDRHQLTSEAMVQSWLARHGMTQADLPTLATRQLKIEKFKQATWGHQLESYFLKRKGQLDQAIYSLLRTQELAIAQEFYFRIQEGEQSFAELARVYSQGPEAQTGGLCGPVELGVLPPLFKSFLAIAKSGQLSAPIQLGEWVVLIRLEKLLPAQLDEPMRQRLLNELLESWIAEQMTHRV
jgi:hypothetical protein